VEKSARAPLRAALKSIRADVAETFPDDADLQRAFGRGKNLDSDSTTILVRAAGDVAGAFEANPDAVKSAGVSAARIADVTKLRDALASADTAQRTEIGARIVAASVTSTLYKSVVKRATQLRKRLARNPATKAASTRRRHAVKKRVKKGTGAPPTGTGTSPW
jgi:hypothetical protein